MSDLRLNFMELTEQYSRGIFFYFFTFWANKLGHISKVFKGLEGWDENITYNEFHT